MELQFGILASGRLGAICTERLLKTKRISFVFTDKFSTGVIELCNKGGIPLFVGNPRNGKAASFIEQFKVDVLLSINYLFIVEKDIINLARKYAINLHGSLLPKYRGRTPHVWAIINNEKETGITAHLITEGCDEGDIVFQEKITINDSDTGATLLEKFNERYPAIISKVIDMIENHTIMPVKQNNAEATYFGKRTPLDGEINWNWQKEQINNWVRAQARPYPGAFTFYENTKVIIHKIEYVNTGFHQNDQNGKILNADQLIVKTPNGAVRLVDFEKENHIIFKIGNVFHAGH
ncbi:methionyl-tRNA formyltransferase [Longitalea arenae]|uniref:methionyl-tRNA formyltransferase n=1 Tax=Longitalea arenae TaxID=2812558 RepID=UPI00196727A8|nr:methionyl-tRNA formyltransferase [Longitalea arenae]